MTLATKGRTQQAFAFLPRSTSAGGAWASNHQTLMPRSLSTGPWRLLNPCCRCQRTNCSGYLHFMNFAALLHTKDGMRMATMWHMGEGDLAYPKLVLRLTKPELWMISGIALMMRL